MPRRPAALEDLLRFKLVGDTQISPDGRKAVSCVKRIDAEKNKYFSSLWMADVESGGSRELMVPSEKGAEDAARTGAMGW